MARPRKEPQPEQEEQNQLFEAGPLEPITEPVEVDLSGEEPAQVNGEAVVPQPQSPPPSPSPPPQDDLSKRLAEMEAAWQRDKARLEGELRNERNLREQSAANAWQTEYDGALNSIGGAQAALEAAEKEEAAADAAGDKAAEIAARGRWNDAWHTIRRWEEIKAALDNRREQERQQPQQQPDPFEQAISALPDRAKNWLRSHPEFMRDPRRNAAMQHAHWQSVDELKSDAMDDRYFESMEIKLGLRQPPAPMQPSPPVQPQYVEQRLYTDIPAVPVSAPPTREVPSMTGQPQNNSKMHLSRDEREIAQTSIAQPLGISQHEAEKIYAQNKKRMLEMKAQGHYPSR